MLLSSKAWFATEHSCELLYNSAGKSSLQYCAEFVQTSEADWLYIEIPALNGYPMQECENCEALTASNVIYC